MSNVGYARDLVSLLACNSQHVKISRWYIYYN